MKELIERIKEWQSTVPGFIKILISVLVVVKLVEVSDTQTILDSVDQIFVGVIGLFTGVNGIMDVFKKDKKE